MIAVIRHKGLRQFYEKGNAAKLNPQWVKRIRLILGALDAATQPDDMNIPGFHYHALAGNKVGFYAVRVTGNWRIIFRYEDGFATDVDLIDYH